MHIDLFICITHTYLHLMHPDCVYIILFVQSDLTQRVSTLRWLLLPFCTQRRLCWINYSPKSISQPRHGHDLHRQSAFDTDRVRDTAQKMAALQRSEEHYSRMKAGSKNSLATPLSQKVSKAGMWIPCPACTQPVAAQLHAPAPAQLSTSSAPAPAQPLPSAAPLLAAARMSARQRAGRRLQGSWSEREGAENGAAVMSWR